MVGMSYDNRRIRKFEYAIEAGELLVLADVPEERIDEVETCVKKHLPQVEIEGTQTHVPAFP